MTPSEIEGVADAVAGQLRLWQLGPNPDYIANEAKDKRERFWYDCLHGIIVAARTEEEARQLARREKGDEGEEAWNDPNVTYCRPIHGSQYSEPTVILKDFRNG